MRYLSVFLVLISLFMSSCDKNCCEPESPIPTAEDRQAQLAYELAIAEEFAPVLVFDQDQGEKAHRCFPMDAGYWFEIRKVFPYTSDCEPDCIIENMDYISIFLSQVPTYYYYKRCFDAEYVMYWWFYGYQPDCDVESGEHSADWERIAVKIVDGKLDRVLFFQHAGQYTKLTSNSELQRLYGGRPVVFVGAQNHGSYHDTGGTGGCCYFQDYRNPGPYATWKKMLTWENLVRLSLDDDSPEWMKCPDAGCWPNCCKGPLHRGEDLCNMSACIGLDEICDLIGDNQQGCEHTDAWGHF